MEYSTCLWCILVLLSQLLQTGETTECVELATNVEIISSETKNSIKLSTYNRSAGTGVDVTCYVKEYEVLGARHLKCLPSGEWDAEKPVCVPRSDLNTDQNKVAIIAGSVTGGCCFIIIIIIVLAVSVYRRSRKQLSTSFDSTFTSEIPLQNSKSERETPFYGLNNYAAEKIFKLWTVDRTQKKLVAACTLSELKSKGAEKFKIMGKPCLVLESDGTEIEDDEGLFAFSDHVLILLAEGEQWYYNDDNVSRQTFCSSQFDTIRESKDGKIHIVIDKNVLNTQQSTVAERL